MQTWWKGIMILGIRKASDCIGVALRSLGGSHQRPSPGGLAKRWYVILGNLHESDSIGMALQNLGRHQQIPVIHNFVVWTYEGHNASRRSPCIWLHRNGPPRSWGDFPEIKFRCFMSHKPEATKDTLWLSKIAMPSITLEWSSNVFTSGQAPLFRCSVTWAYKYVVIFTKQRKIKR